MEFGLNVKENAIDSLNEGLAKFELGEQGDLRSYKFAILHMAHFVELVLKLYLTSVNQNIVFSKCFKEINKRAKSDNTDPLTAYKALEREGFDFTSLIKNEPNPHTVDVEKALSLARCESCQITGAQFVEEQYVDDINWMKDLRNNIAHFEFRLTPKEVRLAIGRLIRGTAEFADVFCLFNLEDEIGKDKAHVFEILSDEYAQEVREAERDVDERREEAFRGVRPKHQIFVDWEEYDCPECEKHTMIPSEDSSTGYRCTLCGNEESFEIEVNCDICGCPWPNGDMATWPDSYTHVCPRCDNPEAW